MPRYATSVVAVARVQRLDGRTRVVAVYRGPEQGWRRVPHGLPLTGQRLEELRADGVRTVRMRRGFRIARVPLTWFPVSSAYSVA